MKELEREEMARRNNLNPLVRSRMIELENLQTRNHGAAANGDGFELSGLAKQGLL